ncbi:Cupredoxin [Sparassis latifolia]
MFVAIAFAAIGPTTDLTIINADIAPDGYLRPAVLAGGTFPGPVIAGNKGDNFQINVNNLLTNETMLKTTSIYWHGIYQTGTNWADGVAFVSQCPIASGDSFLYDFTIPDQAGTFWYHSHLATQYCDGLRGAFVVYDPDDPFADMYDVDNDSTIITLADWYHVAAALEPLVPTPDATLINGLGPSYNGSDTPLAVITVQQGLRYRIRLVSISCDPNFIFSIDGHNMTIIETDGVNTDPLVVDSLQIYAAQRYSFILVANQPINNYWVRALPNRGPAGYAILRYDGAPIVGPQTNQSVSISPLAETNLHPLIGAQAPGEPTDTGIDLALNLITTNNGTKFFMNSVTFVPPPVPVLLQILSGVYSAQDLLPAGSVYTLPSNSTIQLSIPGGVVGGGHPLHLHGHTFSVVRSASSDVYNYDNPVQRDTVNIGVAGDNVTVRFNTNNSGPWLLHCHIDRHLANGFAVVMAEAPTLTTETPPGQSAWSDLCPVYDALSLTDH